MESWLLTCEIFDVYYRRGSSVLTVSVKYASRQPFPIHLSSLASFFLYFLFLAMGGMLPGNVSSLMLRRCLFIVTCDPLKGSR